MSLSLGEVGASAEAAVVVLATTTSQLTVALPGETPAERSASTPKAV